MHNPYKALKEAGCEIDSHESDLYVKSSLEASRILKESGWGYTLFIHQITGELWLDVPFAYLPFWERKTA